MVSSVRTCQRDLSFLILINSNRFNPDKHGSYDLNTSKIQALTSEVKGLNVADVNTYLILPYQFFHLHYNSIILSYCLSH